MSNSTATALTPRASRETLRKTLDDFRTDCAGWQRDVSVLFDDVDGFLNRHESVQPTSHAESPRADSGVAGIRRLIEQQTEILTALVSALAEHSGPPSSDAVAPVPQQQPTRRGQRSSRRRSEPEDEHTGMLLRQFQEMERIAQDEGR